MASQNVAGARAAFLPSLQTTLQRNTTQQAPQTFENGTSAVGSSNALTAQSSVSQFLPWYGSRYNVVWSGNRNASVGGNSTFNPRLGSTLAVNFTQPLWRGFLIDSNRYNLDATSRQREITDLQLQGQIVATEVSVRFAYLGLLAAIESLKVAQQNMDLNQKQLDNSKARVKVGAAAEIEIIQAEASVESSREQVIVAEAGISTAEDQLRALIMDPSRPDYWQVHIKATDSIEKPAAAGAVDIDRAIKNALANRLDLQAARRNMEITTATVKLDNNLTKPQVDFTVNYQASGTGGTQLTSTGTAIKNFGSVLGDAFGGTYPSWTVGVNVAYPIGQSAAQATLARARLQQQQQQIDLHSLEISVTQAVRQAGRDVETALKRVQATQSALEANNKQLEAEQRKQAVGLSTTFDVLQKSSLLAQARIQWLNAIISYSRSLVQFERVQKIQ
jgi:outer membrane protein TolC